MLSSLAARIALFGGLFSLLALLAFGASAQPSNRPNVVLFLVDDYGYGDIGFEGNQQVATPHIDRLALESVRLTNFYQSAGACAPTRAALLTGRDFFRVGVWGVHWGRDFINRDERTLGNLFQDAGYRTGVFGKWHSGKTAAFRGWNRGFDTSVHTKLYDYWDTMVLADNKVIEVAGPITDVVGDRAVAFIKAAGDDPFFCYVPFQAVHEPFNAPAALFEKYQARGYSDHVARLYGMIEVLDQNVGKVLDALTPRQAENTIVLFMVDDGSSPGFDLTYQTRRMNETEREERRSAWGRRLRGTKANQFEGGQISPCYIRWPAGFEGDRDDHTLSGILDIYPTLAELCFIPLTRDQKPLDGRSLAGTLRGEAMAWPDRVYIDATNLYLIERPPGPDPHVRWMTARYQNYKYQREDRFLIDGSEDVRHLLFDLETDATESTNVAAQYPEVTAKLRSAVEGWYADVLTTPGVFSEAVYPIGHWNEHATPINLDATVEVLGDLHRDPGPGFYFTGWDAPGDGLAYRVDVVEAGEYVIVLDYEAELTDLGATLSVGVGDHRVSGEVSDRARAQIGPLSLPAGEAVLDLRLESLGRGPVAMDWLRSLAVQRIPTADDMVLRDVRFVVQSTSGSRMVVEPASASYDFAVKAAAPALRMSPGEMLTLSMTTANPRELERWSAHYDFQVLSNILTAEGELGYSAPSEGSVTLNLTARHLSGREVNARIKLIADPELPPSDGN